MFTHDRVGVVERQEDLCVFEGAESLQGVKRVKPTERAPGMFNQIDQRSDCALVPPLVQQAGGSVAVPAIRVLQSGDQFGNGGLAKLGRLSSLKPVGHDAVKTPAIVA